MKNVFITGANGFVGQHVTRHILDKGWTPITLIKDKNRKSNPELSAQVQRRGAELMGSILDKDLIRYIVGKYELDYVIHLAAIPIVKTCDADPWTAYQTNIMGSVVLYEAIRDQMQRDNRIQKIIHMSTDKAYGDSSPPGGYMEDTPFVTTDTYCVSKACGDMVARSYAQTYGLPTCVVRCGNLYGEGDLNLSRLIPGTILRLLNKQQPVLYSDAAKMRREFIHVSDAVSAYMTLLERGEPAQAYNIGTGGMHSIKDVIDLIRKKIDSDIEIKMVNRDLFEINEQSLDATKLRSLGWEAMMSLDKGLHQSIAWYRWWRNQQ